MASDFTYEGYSNGHHVFREKATGASVQLFPIHATHDPGAAPTLLDGDEVALPGGTLPGDLTVYSLRPYPRIVRTERR